MTQALTYVEIEIPYCANTYGVLPCTASLTSSPPTGTRKCFNSPKTCQDRENYIDDPVTLRFAVAADYLPRDIEAIPSISSVSFTPAVVSLGKDLGQRATLSVSFRDHPWSDTGPGYDKYWDERDYDPFRQGTYWGKFRARQPYLRGQPLRLIRGAVGQSLAEMETRHFVIDSFDHDASDGAFKIVAKDVLKLADGDRAQAPLASGGFLVAAIDADDLVATLSPSGIGDEDYPVSGYAAIGGKEIVSFTRDLLVGNDADTHLLLHADGVDASTTFTDSSSAPHTATAVGNAQIDQTSFKFGNGSILLDGAGDYITFPDHADWTPSGNFTIDFWALHAALTGTHTYFTHYTDANNHYRLTVSSAGAITFAVVSSSSTIITLSSANGVITTGAFHHIALVRDGNDFDIYVDGVSVASVNDNSAIPNFTQTFRIGANGSAANFFNGAIDEFRISHVARWTAGFTPPISPYASSTDVLNITRAQLGTDAQEHDAQDRVQLVLRYISEDPADIIYDLFVNYAGIDPAFIPLVTWQTETASFLNRLFSADIAEPTPVDKLVSEMIEDGALSLWWDDVDQLLRLRVLRSISTDAAVFDADNILEGSFSSREQPSTRASQIWRYFAKRNPLEGQEDPDNYRSIAIEVDLQAETDYGSSAIHKIFSRWIPLGGRTVADRANALYLSRFRDPPRRFSFRTFRDGQTVPALGVGYRVEGMGIQDDTGFPTDAPIQITHLNPGDAEFAIEAEEMLVAEIEDEDLNDRVIIIDVNSLDLNLRTLHDALFPDPTDADVGNGVNLTCYVEAGAIVGSRSTSSPAFEIGDWPVGFPITLVVNGRIQGRGGDGSSRAAGNYDGLAGGVALYTRFDIDLEVTGEIWGGAGGGASSGTFTFTINGGVPAVGSFNNVAGAPGTSEAGGAGGNGGDPGSEAGAAGGGPGLDGVATTDGVGGAAGAAIDGVSFVTVTVGPGDRRGPEIN